MGIIDEMLLGKIEMKDFISYLCSDDELQSQVRKIIPIEAVNNQDHPLWKRISFDSFARHNFDFFNYLKWICRFDETICDNFNIFSSFRTVYGFTHPELIYTDIYDISHSLYLDVVKDCFDGLEVRDLVSQIIRQATSLESKRKRVQQARTAIKTNFHVVDNKRPRWIQGAEWPMGILSPMIFEGQKRNREVTQYFFRDVDTGDQRVVEQWY